MTAMFIMMISALAMNMFMMMNPLSMGVSILFMALTVAMLFSYSMSSWIAFLIFLIYIGGMLVMFSYFVSLTPNQTINMLSITLMLSLTYMSLISIMALMNIKSQPTSTYLIQTNAFYLKSNTATLLLLATILLITMIIVVKLTINMKGPMRPFMSNKYV